MTNTTEIRKEHYSSGKDNIIFKISLNSAQKIFFHIYLVREFHRCKKSEKHCCKALENL